MTDEDTRGYLSLCQEAARIATSGGDVEDVAQELFLWILETPSIKTPSYRGLKGLLIRQAKKIVADDRSQSTPHGWTEAWTTEEIRSALRSDYYNLPPVLAEALASPRMPQQYRAALAATYGRGEVPSQGSALRTRMYRAVARLQRIVNFPTELASVGRVDVDNLIDVCGDPTGVATDRATEQRRRALLGQGVSLITQ